MGRPKRLVRRDDYRPGGKPWAFDPSSLSISPRLTSPVPDRLTIEVIKVSSRMGEPMVSYGLHTLERLQEVDPTLWDIAARNAKIGGPVALDWLLWQSSLRVSRSEVRHDGYVLETGQQRLRVDKEDKDAYTVWLRGMVRRLPNVPPDWRGWYYREKV